MLQPSANLIAQLGQYSEKRPLPPGAEVLVKVGQVVRPEVPVARVTIALPSVHVAVGVPLGVQDEELARCLVKQVGDQVEEGDVLARKGSLLGGRREVRAPETGVVDLVLYDTGEVVISRPKQTEILMAESVGQVSEIVPGKHLTIETPAAVFDTVLGVGSVACGTLRVATRTPSGELTEDLVSGDLRDCVLVGGVMAREQVMHVARRMGVVGLIVGGAPALRHESWLGPQPAVPLTIALTEGFGAAGMHGEIFELLKRWEGQPVLIRRTEAGRARVVVVLPSGTASPAGPGAPGSVVRILRRPHFGAEGRIVEQDSSPRLLPSGLIARVAQVELADGAWVTVPLANLEILR